MYEPLLIKIREHVKARLVGDRSSHDWFHVDRTVKLALYIQGKEGGDVELVEAIALLHCTIEHDPRRIREERHSYAMEGVLDVLDVPEHWREKVLDLVRCLYRGKDTKHPVTLEGKIVQDATFLDSLGAVGIARIFSAGGYMGRLVYNPTLRPFVSADRETFLRRKNEGTSFNYIFEKSANIMTLLNTQTAKRIAQKRRQFVDRFLAEFGEEWDLADIN